MAQLHAPGSRKPSRFEPEDHRNRSPCGQARPTECVGLQAEDRPTGSARRPTASAWSGRVESSLEEACRMAFGALGPTYVALPRRATWRSLPAAFPREKL